MVPVDEKHGTKSMRAGELWVYLKAAKNIKGDEFCGFGKADPYAALSLGSKCHANRRFGYQKSSVKKNAGGNPTWDETFYFYIEHSGLNKSILYIDLFDRDRASPDQSLGHLRIDIAHLLDAHNDRVPYKEYTVYQGLRHKERGKVELALSFRELPGQGSSTHHGGHKIGHHVDAGLAFAAAGVALGVGQVALGAVAL